MNRMLKPRFLLTSPTPLPFSWISLIATNIGAFLVTLYLAYKPYDAQLTSIRHSLLLWIVIGVVAALRGTFLQAVASTFTVETVSILTFFFGWAIAIHIRAVTRCGNSVLDHHYCGCGANSGRCSEPLLFNKQMG